jgi:hypothetical protein
MDSAQKVGGDDSYTTHSSLPCHPYPHQTDAFQLPNNLADATTAAIGYRN